MHMLANAYVDLGHDVTVVSPSLIKDENARYQLISVPLAGRNRLIQWAMFLRTFKYAADILHFGGDDHLVSKIDGMTHIRTFHGSCFAETIVATRLRDKIRMAYLGCTELLSQRPWKITTAVSTDTNKYFLKKNLVIPNGVDLLKFTPGHAKSLNPSILFVGTLDSRKRGRKLVQEFSRFVLPAHADAELWIVRDNESIESPGVRVFGSVTQAKLIELYQKAWVFCLPSSYEGFGVPYIEAMACGTPVVATPNPGALEVLDGGRYGVLTDLDLLGTNLALLLADEKRREDLTTRGLHRVRNYDIHEIAQKYINLSLDFTQKRVRQ
jgi:phosphatidylinositol alpha-mannosyltransferase